MSPHPRLSRLKQALRRTATGVRTRHVVVLSSVTAAAVFGLLGLRAVELPGPRPIPDGERLRIEVVHPIEPDIVPGAPMDVGDLVTGFQGPPPAPPPLTEVVYTSAGSWMEDLPPLPPPPWRRAAPEATADHPPRSEPRERRREGGRWFGFDAPRPDYQAERAARRARLEALDRQAWEEREVRRRVREERLAEDRRWADWRREDRRRGAWRRDDPDDRGPWRDGYEEDVRAEEFVDRERVPAYQ